MNKQQMLENKLRKMIREELKSSGSYSASHTMATHVLAIKNNSILFEKKMRDGSLTDDDVDVYIEFVSSALNVIKKDFSSKRK